MPFNVAIVVSLTYETGIRRSKNENSINFINMRKYLKSFTWNKEKMQKNHYQREPTRYEGDICNGKVE